MKTTQPPRIGTPGPRRPLPPPPAPSLNEAGHQPHGSNSRLVCEQYWSLPATLPNGLPRPTRLMADALLCIGGDFKVKARVFRPESGSSLHIELEQLAWDMVTNRQVIMPPYSAAIIHATYEALAFQQVLASARQSGRGQKN